MLGGHIVYTFLCLCFSADNLCVYRRGSLQRSAGGYIPCAVGVVCCLRTCVFAVHDDCCSSAPRLSHRKAVQKIARGKIYIIINLPSHLYLFTLLIILIIIMSLSYKNSYGNYDNSFLVTFLSHVSL
jgi:hypothetical protein